MRLVDHQAVPVAGGMALAQGLVQLGEARLGAGLGLLQRGHGGHQRLGDVGRLERLALLVVVFHPQHVGLDQQDRLVLADDAVFQVAHQRGLAGAALGHHGEQAAMLGRLEHRLADVADVRADVHVLVGLDVILERVAEQPEMLAGGWKQGLFAQ